MEHFEKLSSFYLGRPYDLKSGKGKEGYLLYDAKDLTTHAVCVGMTGSGKTGLCISLLEEAAIDGIPSIVIDPKGDMGNLMLTFPELRAEDFKPWVNPDDAARKNLSVDDYASQQAETWRKGLASWGQDGERIRQMRETCEFSIYTPGSTAGRPVSVLQSFKVPEQAILEDPELLHDQVSGTAGSLLGLLGIDADPIRSREHILISNILLQSWQNGHDLELADLIELIQNPPFNRIGVMELDAFYPAKDRFALAMQFNNLLASPGFSAWMNGEPLSIGNMLRTNSGQPRLSIFSIAHLNDSERMFFVSLLLSQVVGWMRTQSGSTSLRAIIYMDEIFGFFPPIANPPSKQPLLTLLKQARAYGIGVVLTTQNPVDLDYKGLANTGTWLIGRLQTERDKQRLLDGLEGAALTQGSGFDRADIEKTMAALGNRVFLLHNVHEDEPAVFETRWAMSYLRGPMTRKEIAKLLPESNRVASVSAGSADRNARAEAGAAVDALSTATPSADETMAAATPAAAAGMTIGAAGMPQWAAPAARPTVQQVPPAKSETASLPGGVRQFYLPSRGSGSVTFYPAVLGEARIDYRDSKSGFATTQDKVVITPISDGVTPVDWDQAQELTIDLNDLLSEQPAGTAKAELPAVAGQARSYAEWSKDFATWVYRNGVLSLFSSPAQKLVSRPGESERDFQTRLQETTRSARERELDALKKKYATKIQSFEEKIRKAEVAVEREADQAKQAKMQTAISFGATILSAFVGRKKVSASSLGRATTTVRGASRSMKEANDINRQKQHVEAYQAQLQELQDEFQAESEAIGAKYDPMRQPMETFNLQPAKKDIQIRNVLLLWAPFREDGSPAWL